MTNKPFWGDGWGKKDLPNGRCEITVPPINVDMIASTEQLMVKTGWAFEKDDIIVICGIKSHVEIVDVICYHPKHDLMLTVKCEKPEKLRELLTYRLGDKAEKKIPPKYKEGK